LLQVIAQKVVTAVAVPVTAKMRIGWSPETKNGVEIAKRIEDAGVELITVHARTRNQAHSGPVDLDHLARIVREVSIPVIGNGGIRTVDDARRMMDSTGVERVAVGQGAKGNPWIFRALAGDDTEVTLTDRIDTCRRHFSLYVEWAGERRAVREMRKHVAWYLKGFDGAAAFRDCINRTVDVTGVLDILDDVARNCSSLEKSFPVRRLLY
jgi:tRNA-dihydrouridine synthase B